MSDVRATQSLHSAAREPEPGELPSASASDPRLPQIPPLDHPSFYLRAPDREDYRFLRHMETSGDAAPTWRFRGSVADPEEWARIFWHGVLVQYVVISKRTNSVLGLVSAYGASMQDGHAHVLAIKADPRGPSPLFVRATGLFIDRLFGVWPFRKLYFDVVEYNLGQFGTGVERLWEVEARLRGHVELDGRHWDQLTLALYRDTWTAFRAGRSARVAS